MQFQLPLPAAAAACALAHLSEQQYEYNPLMIDPMEFAAELRTAFEGQPDIVLAYLFGSHARRQAAALSDVDLAILLADAPDDDQCFARRLEIMGMAMSILRINDVDVATLNRLPLALRYRVVREGKMLFCRDENARIAFEAQTTLRYLDYKPVIDLFERAALGRARKGELLSGYNPHRGSVERYLRRRESSEGTPTPHV